MAHLRVTHPAKRDLSEIGRYTEGVWGRDQRVKYLASLKDGFHDIVSGKVQGVDASQERAGYRKLHIGRHYIYFRWVSSEVVEIVRVLHDMMNSSDHL